MINATNFNSEIWFGLVRKISRRVTTNENLGLPKNLDFKK